MIEFFKRLIKCHLQRKHKISIITGACVRCNYDRNERSQMLRVR